MNIFKRFFFQKQQSDVAVDRILIEQRNRINPLRGLDPAKITAAIDAYKAGELGDLARIVAALEERDDTMRAASRKMRAAAARCPHQVLIVEGEEKNPEAARHQEILKRFWANIRVTSALCRNERGGIRLLKKQMMDAMSIGYATHEIVWQVRPEGLTAKFVSVPLWFFENRTGELRYLRDSGYGDGEAMPEGEWMVATGDGVGIAASVAAMGKRLSFADWLIYSERAGQPGLHGKTTAAQGSAQWETLVHLIANFGRGAGLVTDNQTEIMPISAAVQGELPYPPLIERMDRAIATLYRGADLSTLSAEGGAVGASLQGEEADILEQDACETLSETLQEQVERFVIRFETGADRPLAYIQISPVSRPNLDADIKIDQHLAQHGVKLSKREALQRYQRTEVDPDDPDDAPLVAPQNPAPMGGFGVPPLPNEAPDAKNADSRAGKARENASAAKDGILEVADHESAIKGVFDEFADKLEDIIADKAAKAAAEGGATK